MRRFIYILIFFISMGRILFAQSTELLEVRLLEGIPLPLGRDWYRTQKEAWKVEINKDKRNARAWENYLYAYDAEYWEESTDSLLQPKVEKEQRKILRGMKKHISDTRTYYRCLLKHTKDTTEQKVLLRQIVTSERTCERDYIYDISYYRREGQMDKIKGICKEWYASGLFSYDFLFYCYNEFSGLPGNAIFVSDTNAALCYRFLLQYGVGLFNDVLIVDSNDLEYPSSQSKFWQMIGIDSEELPDWKRSVDGKVSSLEMGDLQNPPKWLNIKSPGTWYLAEKKNRPVYYPQFTSKLNVLEKLKGSLYSEGLVFRYSAKPYRNLAIIRKNYEQNYLLDYLRQPLIKNSSVYFTGMDYLKNYIVSLSPLLRFYDVSGDKNQAAKLRRLLQGILDKEDGEEMGDTGGNEFQKLMTAVRSRLMEMSRQGDTSITVTDLREQYQKLIDPVEP